MEKLYLLDKNNNRIGELQNIKALHENVYSGKIIFMDIPKELLKKFRTYEEYVNEQIFSLVDDLEKEIAAHGFKLSSGEAIQHLQIMNEDDVSFRMLE